MRDYIVLYINGKECRVAGADAFLPLSSYLRYVQSATGTKVVCEEGDCGACTVLSGAVSGDEIAYRPINACIQNVYQLDLRHVITIEGLKVDGELNCVQKSMVQNQGAQCGFCTPGIVVAMCSLFDKKCESKTPATEEEIRDALTGNLCRCTGYEPIIRAGLETNTEEAIALRALYPSRQIIESIGKHKGDAPLVQYEERIFFGPQSISEAVEFKAKHAGTTIIQGGTDVCVQMNKRGFDPKVIMSLNNVSGLNELNVEDGILRVGGRATLAQLEEKVTQLIPEFADILWVFGSPQIKNAGTLAGNIVNASPIADTIPFLYVMDAEFELTGSKGVRKVKADSFYKGYKKLDLQSDEIVTQVNIPLPKKSSTLKLYKVSKRKNLDISTFTAAVVMERENDQIRSARIAYGGVAEVVLRLPKTEEFLAGKKFTEETFVAAGKIARGEIRPISDVRGEADFRLILAETILEKFFHECNEEQAAWAR
jgi:xanthine dehydrogenase small subunit